MDAWPGRLPAPGGRQRLRVQMQRWKWRAKDALRQGERVVMETNRGGKDPHWDGLGATGATGTVAAVELRDRGAAGASALSPAERLDQGMALCHPSPGTWPDKGHEWHLSSRQ